MPAYLSQADLVSGMYLWYVPRDGRLTQALLVRVGARMGTLIRGDGAEDITAEALGSSRRFARAWRASIEDDGWFFIPFGEDVEPPPAPPKEEKRAKRLVADIPPRHRQGLWLGTPSPTKKQVHHVLFSEDAKHSLCFRTMSGPKRAWEGEIYVCGLCRHKLAKRLGLAPSG